MYKRIILSFMLLAVYANVHSQNSNVQSASNSLKYDEIPEAKSYIDKAAENDQTSNNPKMWLYRGKVYLAIKRSKKPEIKALDADAAEKSTVSFINCIKTDTREMYKDEAQDLVWVAAIEVFNDAATAYTNNELEKAAKLYNMIFEVIPYDKDKNLSRSNITADVLNKNLGLTAYKAKDYKKAKEYMQKLVDANYNDPWTHIYMSRIHAIEKDTAKAIQVIDKAAVQFEGNKDVSNEQIILYSKTGNTGGLIAKFTKAIEENPDKEELYLQRGDFYQKANQSAKALEDYKKALSINPDIMEANFNAGVIIYNEAAIMINAANDIKNDNEFAKAKTKAENKFKEALPFFEKAQSLNPDDKETLQLLKKIYARLGQNDKYEKVKAQLEGK